jgi:lysyl-tRNA synthetase class 2
MSLTEIRNIRIAKAQKLREMGIDPYPSKSKKEYKNNEVVTKFEEFDGKKVVLAGRLMSWREHGKLIFGHLSDEVGKIKYLFRKIVKAN